MISFVVIAVLVGVTVGLFSGLLGIGGGTLMVSIFNIAYGLSGIQATATSLFTIIPTSVSGALTHIRNKTCIWKVGIAAGLGGAIASPLGVWLASISPEIFIISGAVFVIAYSAISMFRKAAAMPKGDGVVPETLPPIGDGVVSEAALQNRDGVVSEVAQVESSPCKISAENDPVPHWMVKAAGIGLLAGVVSGYVGVGGGFLMVPLFITVLKMPMRVTSGSSLIAVMILAIPGSIAQACLGNINWMLGICVAAGSVPGAIIGARLVKRVPERTLRYLFAAFLMLSAAALLLNQFLGQT